MAWYMIAWDRWITMYDERVCPRCLALHGREFRQGEGPQPPLHTNCRCRRVFDHIEYTKIEPAPPAPRQGSGCTPSRDEGCTPSRDEGCTPSRDEGSSPRRGEEERDRGR